MYARPAAVVNGRSSSETDRFAEACEARPIHALFTFEVIDVVAHCSDDACKHRTLCLCILGHEVPRSSRMPKIDIAAVRAFKGSGYPPPFDAPCATRTRRH